jgi:hypothetical protein
MTYILIKCKNKLFMHLCSSLIFVRLLALTAGKLYVKIKISEHHNSQTVHWGTKYKPFHPCWTHQEHLQVYTSWLDTLRDKYF